MQSHRFVSILLAVTCFLTIVQPVRAEDIPPEAQIAGIAGHAQHYTLSCESRSAADWAAFWGFKVTEDDLLAAMPRSDNPETGFVGSPSGAWGSIPPYSYGVHPPPLVAALRSLGVPAQEKPGLDWDGLRREIAAGRPVIAWIIGQMWRGTPISYTDSAGRTTTVAHMEHTMIVTGYTAEWVYVVDAYTGLDLIYSVDTFLTSWGVLGQRAIVAGEEMPARPAPGRLSTSGYTIQRGDTLTGLAARYNIAWNDLAALNNLAFPYLLYAGQALQIPGLGDAASSDSCPNGNCASQAPASRPTPAPSPTPTARPTTIPTATQTKAAASEPDSTETYTVQSGDTLMRIANRYALSWPELVLSNAIPYPYTIYPGQIIRLPGHATETPLPAATQTPAAPTPTATVPPTQPPATPGPDVSTVTYTVQRGDYLTALAGQWGMDWIELAGLNGIQPPYQIYPGQVLRLR